MLTVLKTKDEQKPFSFAFIWNLLKMHKVSTYARFTTFTTPCSRVSSEGMRQKLEGEHLFPVFVLSVTCAEFKQPLFFGYK
jgi:hypothetical protein